MIGDKWQESWDRMEEKERRDIGEAPEPCAACDGSGHDKGSHIFKLEQCPRCLGTGVES